MGYTNIDNDLISDKNLSSSEFRIFVYLLQHWNKKYGYSFPTRKQITENLGMGNNTVNNSLKSLEAKGYITISKYKTKNGTNNIYYINKYLVGQQNSSGAFEEPKPSNKSTNDKKQLTGANKKPKQTAWSDHYKEQHWQRYSEDELEKKLLKSQEEKRKAAVKAFREKIG